MNFSNPLFLISILVGAIFVIAGIILLKLPPKKINELYGYRTKNSMKNLERWNFAQKFSSKLMIYEGLIFMAISIIGLVIDGNPKGSLIISLSLMFGFFGFLFFKTEKAIKEKFDNN